MSIGTVFNLPKRIRIQQCQHVPPGTQFRNTDGSALSVADTKPDPECAENNCVIYLSGACDGKKENCTL